MTWNITQFAVLVFIFTASAFPLCSSWPLQPRQQQPQPQPQRIIPTLKTKTSRTTTSSSTTTRANTYETDVNYNDCIYDTDDTKSSHCRRRRQFFSRAFRWTCTFTVLTSSFPAQKSAMALGEGDQRMVLVKKPKAPLGALIPAIQQRLVLEECKILTSKLVQYYNNNNKDESLTSEAKDMTQKQRQQQIDELYNTLDFKLGSTAGKKNKKKLPTTTTSNDSTRTKSSSPYNQVLSGTLSRKAMNIYTSNLQYGDNPEYTVTDPQWKKSYIRANDGLPDIQRVIVADLDLRDLYRNQVQVKLDDAVAEWALLSSSSSSSSLQQNTDQDDTKEILTELQELLQDAASAFDAWLDKIDSKDVQEALQAVVMNGQSVKVYDSYYAGFLPPPSPPSGQQ